MLTCAVAGDDLDRAVQLGDVVERVGRVRAGVGHERDVDRQAERLGVGGELEPVPLADDPGARPGHRRGLRGGPERAGGRGADLGVAVGEGGVEDVVAVGQQGRLAGERADERRRRPGGCGSSRAASVTPSACQTAAPPLAAVSRICQLVAWWACPSASKYAGRVDLHVDVEIADDLAVGLRLDDDRGGRGRRRPPSFQRLEPRPVGRRTSGRRGMTGSRTVNTHGASSLKRNGRGKPGRSADDLVPGHPDGQGRAGAGSGARQDRWIITVRKSSAMKYRVQGKGKKAGRTSEQLSLTNTFPEAFTSTR